MTEKQKVKIKMTTTIEQMGDISTTKINVDGELQKFENKHTLEFTEIQDDGNYLITLDIHDGNEILLNRRSYDGQRLTNIYFSEGKRNNIILRTEHGEIVDLDCKTEVISIDENLENNTGDIFIGYQIWQKENLIGDYQIKLIFS